MGPAAVTKIQKIYNGCIYGSNVFDLKSEQYKKFITAYNAAIRNFWNMPRNTHRFWSEVIAGVHLETQLRANMIKFFQKLVSHEKQVIRIISNNLIRK